jgi:hypothetical protein
MELAGADHITIAPRLLQELATTPASSLNIVSLFDNQTPANIENSAFEDRESDYRIAFTRSDGGEGERKLTQVSELAIPFNVQD